MALSAEDIQAIDARLKTQFADALAGAGEQLAAQAQSAAKEAITEAVKTLKFPTPEELAKTVKTVVASALTAAQAAQAANQAAEADGARKKTARDGYVAAKAPKLPELYRALVPETEDEAELATGLAAAIAKFKADVAASGGKLADLGSSANGTGTDTAAAAQLDRSKLSPTQKIEQGLSERVTK